MDNNLQDILTWMSQGKEMVLTRESVFLKEMKDVNARKIQLEKVLQDGKKKLKFLKDDSSMLANLAKEKNTVIRELQQALASLPKDLQNEVETMSRSTISGDGDSCSTKRQSGELDRKEARVMQTPSRKVPQMGAFQLSRESYAMKRKVKEPNTFCSVTDKKSPLSTANNKLLPGFQHQPPPTSKSFKLGKKFSSIEGLGCRPRPAEGRGATTEHTETSQRSSFIHDSGNQKQAFPPPKSSVCSWQPQVSSTWRERSQGLDSGWVARQGAMLNYKEMTMRRSSAPLKDEPPRFQFQESDTSQLQSSWLGACAGNRVTEEAELDVAGRFRNEADVPLKGRSYQGDTPRKHFTAEPHIVIQNGLVIKSILKKKC